MTPSKSSARDSSPTTPTSKVVGRQGTLVKVTADMTDRELNLMT